MHIGFLQTYFSRQSVGGGERHTENLARKLEARGHKVTIFTDKPNQRRKGIGDLDVREYPTPVKLNPISELFLGQRAFEDLQMCDVVTLTDDSAWRGVDLPVPTVMVFHIVWHGWVERHRPLRTILRSKPQALLYRQMERKICRKVDKIIAISPNIKEDIMLIGDVSDKITHIPNGVDTERFVPVQNTYDEFTVLFQGRLVRMKNPNLLVEAAIQSQEDWKLLIGGDGPLLKSMRERVNEAGIQHRVKFLGYVSEKMLPKHYAMADVFALPSDYEGMPLTVLEAAAGGTAVLASPRAATDFITDDMGMVVDIDVETIASTLDNLASNPESVELMGKAARERAEDYSWDNIAEKYEDIFVDLLNGKT